MDTLIDKVTVVGDIIVTISHVTREKVPEHKTIHKSNKGKNNIVNFKIHILEDETKPKKLMCLGHYPAGRHIDSKHKN